MLFFIMIKGGHNVKLEHQSFVSHLIDKYMYNKVCDYIWVSAGIKTSCLPSLASLWETLTVSPGTYRNRYNRPGTNSYSTYRSPEGHRIVLTFKLWSHNMRQLSGLPIMERNHSKKTNCSAAADLDGIFAVVVTLQAVVFTPCFLSQPGTTVSFDDL